MECLLCAGQLTCLIPTGCPVRWSLSAAPFLRKWKLTEKRQHDVQHWSLNQASLPAALFFMVLCHHHCLPGTAPWLQAVLSLGFVGSCALAPERVCAALPQHVLEESGGMHAATRVRSL